MTRCQPSTSRFNFSKGNYGNIVLAWHSILIQKAKANLPSICAQACKALGVTDVEIGNDKQQVNPKVRTCVGLDSESESDEENIANNGDPGNDNSKDDRNGDIGYHINNGNNDDVDDGNGHNNSQNDAGPSRSEFEVVYSAEKNDGGNETEVDPGLSHLRGRCSTQSYGRK